MTAAIKRLEYMRGFFSSGNIQAQTGIHWARQNAYLRGTASLTKGEITSLTNSYVRLAYNQLRDSGMSVSQATRFRYYTPSSLTQRVEVMDNLVSRLTQGAMNMKMAREGELYEGSIYLQMYTEMESSILEGLRTSKKMYESWKDYGI